MRVRKTLYVLLLDAAAIAASFIIAFQLRFDFASSLERLIRFALVLPFITLSLLLGLSLFGIYSRRWQFASLDEVLTIAKADSLFTVLLCVCIITIGDLRALVPLSVALSGGAISLLALSATRAGQRFVLELQARRTNHSGTGVLLVGAGSAGELIARDILHNPGCGYTPRAFVDDDPLKSNLILRGIPVLGRREDIPDLVKKLGIDEIFITMPSAGGNVIREIVDICDTTEAKVKILPEIARFLQGDPGLSAVREIRVEDLLGREPVELDLDPICGYLRERAVLVTGAGGSIGSELSREILRFSPARLILLDNDETALFNLQSELGDAADNLVTLFADIREEQRIRSIFNRYRPDIVFHSAALKHVPMMEFNPCEAVKNNIMGTMNLAGAAADFRSERFLFISTDKAVNPVNVMGATKRLAEIVVKMHHGAEATAFGAVRFGNVLGSRGSVVPIFEAQIKAGGPVLVTHPDMTRYFMTINEAAQLVIQAGAYLKEGELFLLDMEEPVRVVELAEKMIAVLGNGQRIDIRFTGLRPGEKMNEELIYDHERLSPTMHPKISTVFDHRGFSEELFLGIERLVDCAKEERERECREMLMELVRLADRVPQDDTFEEHLVKAGGGTPDGGLARGDLSLQGARYLRNT